MSTIIRKSIFAWFIPIIVSILVSGCGSGDTILEQDMNTTVDAVAPTVISTDPAINATNVSLNRSVSALFSESLNPETVTTSSFHLLTTSGNVAVAGSLTYAGNTMLFNPDVAFAPLTQYTATITTDVTDLAGNALAVDKVWKFTTGATPDTTAPTVTSVDPTIDATNVPLNKSISALFSESLDSTTVNTNTFSLVTTIGGTAVSGAVSYSGNTIVFNPDATNLDANTQYTATITTDVKDLAGNALAVAKVWNFTTAAILPPTVAATSPENGDINVSTSLEHITAEFSVPMDSITLNTASFTLSKGNPGVLETGTAVTYANKVADLSLHALPDLDANTTYTATVTTDANSADGVALTSNYIWTFTTGLTLDTTPPTVISTSPRDGALDVHMHKLLTATFSEPMYPPSITAPLTFNVWETNTSVNVVGTVTYSVINNIAYFKPDVYLKPDTNYTSEITTEAHDLTGLHMEQDVNGTFVTVSADTPAELVHFDLASTYGIAAAAGITNTPTAPNTQIDGDAVLNPTATCNAVTVDGDGTFGACGGSAPIISGIVVSKTPAYPDETTAQNVTNDLRAAYLMITPENMPGGTAIAAGTTLGAPTGNAMAEEDNLFYTGVYTSDTSILITGDLTLDAQNDPEATFVFQAGSSLTTTANTRILLIGGAKASNVYWQVGSSATLGTGTIWNGNILAAASITMENGTDSCGRLFAGASIDSGAFVFDSNRVSVPGNAFAPTGCE
jgi:hypothetical protein